MLKKVEPEGTKVVPLFIQVMTPYSAICSRDQRTVIMR